MSCVFLFNDFITSQMKLRNNINNVVISKLVRKGCVMGMKLNVYQETNNRKVKGTGDRVTVLVITLYD